MKLRQILAAVTALCLCGSALPAAAEDIAGYGDFNNDSYVDAADAAIVLQYAAYSGAGGTLTFYEYVQGGATADPDEEPTTPVEPAPEATEPEATEPMDPTDSPTDSTITDTDSTLTVAGWSDAYMTELVTAYQEAYPDADIRYLQVGNGSGVAARENYAALLNSGEDVDVFITEPSWATTYINDAAYTAPLSAVGLTAADYSDVYAFTEGMMKNSAGALVAACNSICPGGYCYRADLAKVYLGISTPGEMQAAVADWETFAHTGARLADATDGTVTMAASLDDVATAYFATPDSPTIINNALDSTTAENFFRRFAPMLENGSLPLCNQWTIEWAQAGAAGTTLGYFYPDWAFVSGGTFEMNGGTTGEWAITQGPEAFWWGGYLFSVSASCNSATEAERFLRYFTVDADSMAAFAEEYGYIVNNQSAMTLCNATERPYELLGGQDYFRVLTECAANIDTDAQNYMCTGSSDAASYAAIALGQYYMNGTDAVLEEFRSAMLGLYPELNAG